MPYRGTNSKRQVVHDKARGTIKDGSRQHFLNEKKEAAHELQTVEKQVKTLLENGYTLYNQKVVHHKTVLNFSHHMADNVKIEVNYPETLNHLASFIDD